MGHATKFPTPLLPGEHALATDPPLARETGDDWRKRPRAFTGRALTHYALDAAQTSQAGMQRLRGQAVTAGTLGGLAVSRRPVVGGLDPLRLTIGRGSGLAKSGEDIQIMGGTVDLAATRVMAPPEAFESGDDEPEEEEEDDAGDSEAIEGAVLGDGRLVPPRPRILGPKFGDLEADSGRPRLAVLVAQPVTVELPDPGDPHCPPDRRDIGWLDPSRVDGARLVLYAWPDDVRAPGGGLDYDIDIDQPRPRCRIAQRIFALEAMQPREAMHPWEGAGVPLALIAFDTDGQIDWIDAAAVQRRAGQPPVRSHFVGTRENPVFAEARMAQFSAHLDELSPRGIDAVRAEISALPPAGLLPGAFVSFEAQSQMLFPEGFDITLTPAIAEEVDRLVGESAGLAPIALDQPEKVELLLPVPAREYDTALLREDQVDPRFAAARDQLLAQRNTAIRLREDMRRRFDVLGLASRGIRGTWPGDGASQSELRPASRRDLPHDAVRGFTLEASGSDTAALTVSGDLGIPVSQDDAVFAWMDWDKGEAPAQIEVRLTVNDIEYSGYLGKEEGPLGNPVGDGANHLGTAEEIDGWQRLEFSVGLLRDKDGKEMPAGDPAKIRIAITGGNARLGAFGTVNASGNFTYVSHGLIARGELDGEGSVDDFGPKLDTRSAYGTATRGELLRSSALTSFLQRWQQPAMAALKALASKDGLEAAEQDLDARLKRTNDAIDVGFVRARADIYRLRQYILGRDEASKLVTSPALADLAVRDESARANADDLAAFLSRMKDAEAAVEKAAATPAGGGGGGTPSRDGDASGGVNFIGLMPLVEMAIPHMLISQPKEEAASSTMMTVRELSTPSAGAGLMGTSLPFFNVMAADFTTENERTAEPSVSLPLMPVELDYSAFALPLGFAETSHSSTLAKTPRVTAQIDRASKTPWAHNIAVAELGLFNPAVSAAEIVGQKPLPGIVERTVTVAERIKQSDAAKSHEYALAGKLAVINTLTRLIEGKSANGGPGIALADLPAPGFALRPAGSDSLDDLQPATLADIASPPAGQEWIDINDIEKLKADAGGDQATAKVHEIAYFSAAVAAIDDAIAQMRLVEGRVDLFQKMLADIRRTLANVRSDGAKLEAALQAQDADLAEIRHDLSVAEALEAEDRAAVEETNARRAATIARYSDRIVFRRPRLAPIVRTAASAEAYPANAPDPMISCLADHSDQPEELREYCALFHDVPVGWFPEISHELSLLNKISSAQKMIALAIARSAALPMLAQKQQAAPRKGMRGVFDIINARRVAAEQRKKQTARLNLAAISRYDLAALHSTIRGSTSMGDLIDGARDRPLLASLAATKLRELANVGACLHAAFTEVEPALRMRWAQIFSVHDGKTPSLSQLGALPGWRSLPIALRRELQDFADWLFARIDRGEPEAVQAIEDLLRIALLLSAHAPVDELVPASLIEPVPVRPGGLVPLRIPPERAWLGQTGMIRDQLGRPVASIRTETITPTHVEARIMRDFGLAREITTAMPIALGGMRVGR